MPESRSAARARAIRVGIPVGQVIKAKKGGYFIAPAGVTKPKAKRAYAECRSGGGEKGTCAAVAWGVQKRRRN